MENKNNLLVKMENTGVYLNNKWLVKDVTLNIEKGKIITLIGPNGSGKTTTAKIALGLYKNISGKVEKYTKKIANFFFDQINVLLWQIYYFHSSNPFAAGIICCELWT